ncbi:hypothetical protein [Xenorhabdus szentirmaii]|uniref:Uncharacterized protein n=1 Tax=Xenorhabdus szentirmaii DSM 16338 TaxID=1427518 RepID=W1J5Q5_9GAMM|nr:hypothetical protein [Xenorhabdus szentirmaii]PHM30412.1 hypothetical protein Xsze_04254 [Xenorhabdus szentirmaii DSM 16338]CDL85186.1 hypothetical protein XSR1_650003 [Xenorhabdus szentirmaii DSM 16338]
MTLSPLEILDLQDQLSDWLSRLVIEDPLTQLDIQDEITVIMAKLGYGLFSTNAFIAVLENLEPYVTTFITMPQICDGADRWWEKTGKQLAA